MKAIKYRLLREIFQKPLVILIESVGASGAISAVVAGAAISDPNLEVMLFFIPGLAVPGVVYALGYLAISIYFDYRGNGRVAHLAHAAGTVYGLVLVAFISVVSRLGFF